MFIYLLQRHVSAYNDGHRQVVYENLKSIYTINLVCGWGGGFFGEISSGVCMSKICWSIIMCKLVYT
jgi:hypothetical protein